MKEMSLFEKLSYQLSIINYQFRNQSFLLAVSGGVDSVVLCYLFKSCNLSFHIAHINFQLRDEESLRDEAFVQSLAQSLQVPVHIQRVDTKEIAVAKKMAIQETARIIRYEYFEQWRQEFHLHKIVTAHHLDDNIETIIFRLCRGTGLKGLLGIPFENENIIRPLLSFSKQDILQYAQENQLSFVEDSSNSQDKYTRNWIRHQLVPLIGQEFPNFKNNINNHLPFWQETYQLYHDTIQSLLRRKIKYTPQGERISIAFLKTSKYSNVLFFELLLRYNFAPAQIAELQKLASSKNGSYMKNDSFTIVKYEKNFLISPFPKNVFLSLLIEKNTHEVECILREKLLLKYSDKIPSAFSLNENEIFLDIRNIQFPLIWRKYKTGDYFYPLGMKKKKKIARFLIDQKIPLTEKEKITVLEDAQKRIVWVVGLRIDDRFKIIPSTQSILTIERKIVE